MSTEVPVDTPPLVVSSDQPLEADRGLLGGKGASLVWMSALGLPVPPFFVLTTRAWREWHEAGRLTGEHVGAVEEMLGWLQARTGRTFGAGPAPLLVSVRSTAAVSMPGMMDTILNLGMTADVVGPLCRELGGLRGLGEVIATFVDTATPVFERPGGAAGRTTEAAIPAGAHEQLLAAIDGVFASWNNERARLYRRINRIPDDDGTAVVVQAMIFGNADARSGTGVLFSRDPVTGDGTPTGEWMPITQGEAIVSGRTTPMPLARLAETQPDVFAELMAVTGKLERAAGQPQDIEFTVQRGVLHLLQARTLKTGPLATCRIALALLEEGAVSADAVRRRLSALDLDELATHVIATAPEVRTKLVGGLAASPGIAHGVVVREVARSSSSAPGPMVLVRPETSPHDLPAMRRAAALVTERGGLTSHAAIVARELRIPCVVGCGSLDGLRDGTEVTVDGAGGSVYAGRLEIARVVPDVVERVEAVLAQAREVSS